MADAAKSRNIDDIVRLIEAALDRMYATQTQLKLQLEG
jgi:hypothetical protein